MELSGAEILIQSLTDNNIDTIFGYPGSCVMHVMDRLYDNDDIRHILVRHEQNAVHAACGYAQSANKPGVVLVTSGPGATNTVAGIADAYRNNIPLVVITGQVSSNLLGTDAFQEADMIGITAPVTKWNCQIRETNQIADALTKAFSIATSGRLGPVLLDITKDAQTGRAEYTSNHNTTTRNTLPANNLPTYNLLPQKDHCAEVLRMLRESEKGMVLIVDNAPYGFYSDEISMFGASNIPGFGLAAAIGAKYAAPDKMICLVAGEPEFQATSKELGTIMQQGLDIKMIVLTNSPDSAANRFAAATPPDLMRLIGAYGIAGERVTDKKNLPGSILKMLNSTESYLLEISGSLLEDA